ncbi:MAG: phosphopentomutase [Anaerolineae bacterium]|nr:phosphopentomutase [Anaerolineae bacterium]
MAKAALGESVNYRCLILVLDSVGVGALPDAHEYGDAGSDTLGAIARQLGGLDLPHLGRLGLGCLHPVAGVPCPEAPDGAYGKMAERSAGKDSIVGHWEIAGLVTERPFPVYPDGFPPEVMVAFEMAIGRRMLGNVVASGTEIIARLGEQHLATGRPIVYTSADSVFQIAAHEDVIPVAELYEICRAARAILVGEHGVARVIARPFVGDPGSFTRTAARKDFGMAPHGETLLDAAFRAELPVVSVGKVGDLFAHRSLTAEVKTESNADGMQQFLRVVREGECSGLVFGNLVDFDTLYGHRNDAEGFAAALLEFDHYLPSLLEAMLPRDVLFITADHGCDPTTGSTDHSREYVPLLCYGADVTAGADLGVRATFADLAATAAELLGLAFRGDGASFAAQILR